LGGTAEPGTVGQQFAETGDNRFFGNTSKKIFWKKYREKIKKVWEDFIGVYCLVLKTGKYQFLLNVFLSGLNWICKFSVITVLLMGFDIPTQPVTFFLFQWIILVIMNLLPTPGGSGGAGTTFYFLFIYFVPGGILGIVTAGWRFITFYFSLIVCSLLFFILGIEIPTSQPLNTKKTAIVQ
jgi:uncharacterized protein (TIRG00374 family)